MSVQNITIDLPRSTIYVSGTVNGVETGWTNIHGYVWSSTVEKSPDDTYQVELTLVSSSGSTTKTSMTLWMGVFNLITDRTVFDVNYAKQIAEKIKKSTASEDEKTQFFNGLKGAYNVSDLNRVEGATYYISSALKKLPEKLRKYAESNGVSWSDLYDVPYDKDSYDVSSKMDWSFYDYFDYDNQTRYLNNIILLASSFNQDTDFLPKSFEKFDWKKANLIEQTILDINKNILNTEEDSKKKMDNTVKAWFYCNEIYGGELN